MGPTEADQPGSRQAGWQRALILAWISGTLVLQVPFQLKFKLGNGAFGYNLMIGLALILIGIATIAGFTRLVRILSRRDAPVEQRVRRSSVFSLGLTTALFITALIAPGGNFVFYFVGLGLLVAWIGHTSFCIIRAS